MQSPIPSPPTFSLNSWEKAGSVDTRSTERDVSETEEQVRLATFRVIGVPTILCVCVGGGYCEG